ncbi:MAG: MoaD/ThiS family protein [Anaerolineales bacterium]|nr:MoaD/ThiS family protein [Anaerolineales bacterium]
MIVVRVPSALRPYTEGQKEISLEAKSVEHALGALTDSYPALKTHLYDETGALRPYVNLFVNEEDVRSLQGAATPLHPGDRLMIVPSIAGGKEAEPLPLQPVAHSACRSFRSAHPSSLVWATPGGYSPCRLPSSSMLRAERAA